MKKSIKSFEKYSHEYQISKNLFYWPWIKQYGQIFSFGLLPHRKPINVVIGSPIKVKEAIKDPTDDEVSIKT